MQIDCDRNILCYIQSKWQGCYCQMKIRTLSVSRAIELPFGHLEIAKKWNAKFFLYNADEKLSALIKNNYFSQLLFFTVFTVVASKNDFFNLNWHKCFNPTKWLLACGHDLLYFMQMTELRSFSELIKPKKMNQLKDRVWINFKVWCGW